MSEVVANANRSLELELYVTKRKSSLLELNHKLVVTIDAMFSANYRALPKIREKSQMLLRIRKS